MKYLWQYGRTSSLKFISLCTLWERSFNLENKKKYNNNNNNNNNNNSIVIIIIVINLSILKTKDCKMGIKTNLLQNNIMNLTCTAMYKPGILNDSNIISENK